MSRATAGTPGVGIWVTLMSYLLGYACIGFLLSIPTDPLRLTVVLGAIVSIGILAWSGASASKGTGNQAFAIAVIGSLALTGTLLWALNLSETKVASGAVMGAFIWGATWLMAAAEEEAMPLAVTFVLIAIGGWAINASVFGIGILFTFVCCTSPALGERLRDHFGPSNIFFMLMVVAELGLGLGWLAHRLI